MTNLRLIQQTFVKDADHAENPKIRAGIAIGLVKTSVKKISVPTPAERNAADKKRGC